MRAAWWWIDRWRKSTAYTDMTAEAQGVYRNLLDELWLRDGALPNDERILAKIGGDVEAWPRVREVVLAHFDRIDGQLRNETHDAIMRESEKRADRQKRYRNSHRNETRNVTPSPSPSPSPTDRTEERRVAAPTNPLIPRGGRPNLESELCSLVRREAELTNRDGAEVMAEVSHYEGARTSKLNPATMSDDRLLNSLLDARARVKRLEEGHVRAQS